MAVLVPSPYISQELFVQWHYWESMTQRLTHPRISNGRAFEIRIPQILYKRIYPFFLCTERRTVRILYQSCVVPMRLLLLQSSNIVAKIALLYLSALFIFTKVAKNALSWSFLLLFSQSDYITKQIPTLRSYDRSTDRTDSYRE